MEQVILVTFGKPSLASAGMEELRRLEARGELEVRAAAIVERARDGSFHVAEEADNLGLLGSVAGGAIGALVGALAGPLGLVVGGMTGVAVGSIADAEEADSADAVVTTMARSVLPGATALVADVAEPAGDVVDSAMAVFGGTVFRRSRFAVEAELAELTAAQGEPSQGKRERRTATSHHDPGTR